MPWSDVHRIPLVHVGGMAINITEDLTSSGGGGGGCDSHGKKGNAGVRSSGRRSGVSGSSAKGAMEGSSGDSSGMGNGGGWGSSINVGSGGESRGGSDGDKNGNSDQADTRPITRRGSSGDVLAVNWRKDEQAAIGIKEDGDDKEGDDSWTHLGRRASLPRGSPIETDGGGGGRWGDDGYQLERMAQATLESVLGHEFAAKYKVMMLSTCDWICHVLGFTRV